MMQDDFSGFFYLDTVASVGGGTAVEDIRTVRNEDAEWLEKLNRTARRALDHKKDNLVQLLASRRPSAVLNEPVHPPRASLSALKFLKAFFAASLKANALGDLVAALGDRNAETESRENTAADSSTPTHATPYPPSRRPPARLPMAAAGINITARVVPTPVH